MKSFLKVITSIMDLLCNTLIVFLILLLAFICYTRFILKDPASITNDYYIYQVVSDSMSPTLKVGDYILVHKENNYRIGDIITYKEEDYYVTHRIKEIKQNEFITQGDANNTKDDVVITKDQIKGKYKKKINGFAKVHKFFTNKHTIIIMVTFAIIVRIGISLLASFVKKR